MQTLRKEVWRPAFLMAHVIYLLIEGTKIYYKVAKSIYQSPLILT